MLKRLPRRQDRGKITIGGQRLDEMQQYLPSEFIDTEKIGVILSSKPSDVNGSGSAVSQPG